MALVLNNLKRVDMPLNKETKPNQTENFTSDNPVSEISTNEISAAANYRGKNKLCFCYIWISFLYITSCYKYTLHEF